MFCLGAPSAAGALSSPLSSRFILFLAVPPSLPLRFWVNVIKNPQFVFDIHKGSITDA